MLTYDKQAPLMTLGLVRALTCFSSALNDMQSKQAPLMTWLFQTLGLVRALTCFSSALNDMQSKQAPLMTWLFQTLGLVRALTCFSSRCRRGHTLKDGEASIKDARFS
jgi:hypothetical protein